MVMLEVLHIPEINGNSFWSDYEIFIFGSVIWNKID